MKREAAEVRLRSKVLLMLCVAVGFVPSFAFADWAAFIPSPLENGAFLDTFSSFERDSSRAGTPQLRWTDAFIREKLTLFSNGYSYHPRFLQYHLSVSGIGRQEDYEASYLEHLGWNYGSGLEYDAKLFLLPEHAYNLTLFAARYEPLFKEQAATQHDAVETSRGASFRYRKKPYFLHASYVNDSIDSAETSSDVTRFGLDGQYFMRFKSGNEVSFNGAFNPSWFSTSGGLDGNAAEYLLGNMLNLQRVRLNSSLTKNSFDQESSASGRFKNDQLAWYEILTGYLPWNFRTDASYRYQDNSGTIEDASGAPASKLSDKGDDIQFDIVHRLYESLDTTYTLLRDSRTFSGGDTTTLSHSLGLNYTKSIPWGRLLAGGTVATSETDNHGQAEAVNESYSATVPGYFVLRQQTQNVVPGSIKVILQCPVQPFQSVPLFEPDNYQVITLGNTVEIYVTSLPLECTLADPTSQYNFLVSYTFAAGDFSLRTNTFGGNTSVQLFEDLLTPYFSYVAVRSDVLSGSFPGVPIDSTTYTTGLIIHRGPLRLRGEYQDLQWEVSPYQAWLAEVQYVSALGPTLNVYGTASYQNKYYPRGTSGYLTTSGFPSETAFTEETEAVSGSVQKQLMRNMSLSAGGSYSRLRGLIDGNAYAVNASWMWSIGRVDLTLGASAYASDTSGTNTIATRRDHEFFYLRFRRQLF